MPDFDAKKIYLVAGKTLNRLKKTIEENRPDVVSGGILEIAQRGSDGTYLSARVTTIPVQICVNGVPTVYNLVVSATP